MSRSRGGCYTAREPFDYSRLPIGIKTIASASCNPLFNNPPPGRTMNNNDRPYGINTGDGYVPVTELGPPPQGEPAFASPDLCTHEWRSAGFDPNGYGLHLFCTRCGKVVIPKPDEK